MNLRVSRTALAVLVVIIAAATSAQDKTSRSDRESCRGAAGAHSCGGKCLQTPAQAACVLPGTSPKLLAQINDYMWSTYLESHPDEGGVAFFLASRWSPQIQGEPKLLRWSIVPDGLNIPNGIGEGSGPSILQAQLTTIFGSVDAGLEQFRAVFDRWDELTGITFVEVGDDGAAWNTPGSANRGDIRLGMKNFGFGGVLAYAGFPDFGDVVFNGSINFDQPADDFLFLRNTFAHELGHAIGLFHVCPLSDTKLMEPFVSLEYDGPQLDDRLGGQRHYGDRFENNNSSATATDVGSGPTIAVLDLSIDDNADLDFFSFDAAANMMATVRVIPVGASYLLAEQNLNDSCPDGEIVNNFAVHDLKLRLLDTDGTTILEEADNNGIGFSEVVFKHVLPAAGGTFFARAFGDATNNIQAYRLTITLEDAPILTDPCPADFNGSDEVDGADLGTLLLFWGSAEGDLDGNGTTDGADLGLLLLAWGPCA